jgi:RNA polymerase sigma-70 factor (ECF subfamily)
MADVPCAPATVPAESAVERPADQDQARATTLVEQHYDFVWRTLRFLGLDDASAEDGAQQVMCVLARRIADVTPGSERSFIFSTTLRVAASLRRSNQRLPESAEDDLEALASSTPSAEELLDRRRAHELLRRVLDALPVELRIVFVLYELEEFTVPQIAETLGIPPGTAASRLRRGREQFRAIVRRMHAVQNRRGEEHE